MKRMRLYKKGMVLMAIAIGFVLSCAPSPPSMLPYDEAASQWDATVDQHIHDAMRAAKLKQLGRRLDALQTAFSSDIDALKKDSTALNADYASTGDDMRQLVGRFERKRNLALAHYRDIIFAMRREVSAKEWKAMID
jgi:hypothetical protein